MEVVCYGCGKGEMPENTILAIEHCQKVNPLWRIEMDVQLTNDKQIILHHDHNTKRTCGMDLNISGSTYKALQKLNAAFNFEVEGHFPYRKKSLQIPRLEEVFSRFPKSKLILDISTQNKDIIQPLVKLVEDYDKLNDIIFGSEYDSIIYTIKKIRPTAIVAAARHEVYKTIIGNKFGVNFLFPLKSNYLIIPKFLGAFQLLSPGIIRKTHRRGKNIFLWKKEGKVVTTFNSKTEYDHLKKIGIDGILSDCPEQLNNELFSKLA